MVFEEGEGEGVCIHLARVKVEVACVELVALGKVGYAHAKVAELVDGCWAFLEALELVDVAVLLVRLWAGS